VPGVREPGRETKGANTKSRRDFCSAPAVRARNSARSDVNENSPISGLALIDKGKGEATIARLRPRVRIGEA